MACIVEEDPALRVEQPPPTCPQTAHAASVGTSTPDRARLRCRASSQRQRPATRASLRRLCCCCCCCLDTPSGVFAPAGAPCLQRRAFFEVGFQLSVNEVSERSVQWQCCPCRSQGLCTIGAPCPGPPAQPAEHGAGPPHCRAARPGAGCPAQRGHANLQASFERNFFGREGRFRNTSVFQKH